MMNVLELTAHIPGAVLKGDGGVCPTSVTTDSRACRRGALFFALRGERYDGHDFALEAAGLGASALVVERWVAANVPQVLVSDAKRALGYAAAAWRSRFALPLIAVAGSNGKTTVTQMIGAILAAAYGTDQRLVTRSNFNNDIGLPLMLLELREGHRSAVLELGMNHPGEMAYLSSLARPTVAVVNNAQREHQEFMPSVEATAHENGTVISALPVDGIAVFPADDPCAAIWRQAADQRRVMDFALRGKAEVTAHYRLEADRSTLAVESPAGNLNFTLPLAGVHNVHNAIAAMTATLAVGVDKAAILAGLESFSPISGRGSRHRTPSGALLIDETYNANPDSVRAAIDHLAQLSGVRILVLGDMGEVGQKGLAYHAEMGRHAREQGIDSLLAIGTLTPAAVSEFNLKGSPSGQHFTSIEALISAAHKAASPHSTLLVKGSRFMKMERVLTALLEPNKQPK